MRIVVLDESVGAVVLRKVVTEVDTFLEDDFAAGGVDHDSAKALCTGVESKEIAHFFTLIPFIPYCTS